MFVRKNFNALIVLLLWVILPDCTVTNDDILQKQLFDLNWKFCIGNHKTTLEKGFNEINWRSIDLPHDWITDSVLINSQINTVTGNNTNISGWYSKYFEIPEDWVGKKFLIEFEGISAQHEIFVNGVSVKCFVNEKQLTQADLTPNLRPKEKNLIAVRIDIPQKSGFSWKPGTGIFSHVWLVIKDSGRKP